MTTKKVNGTGVSLASLGIIHASSLYAHLCMNDGCGFQFVRYKRQSSTDFCSRKHAVCPLSGIKKRPLVGGFLYISTIVISIGATASVLYREVVRWWEGPLWEVPLCNPLSAPIHVTTVPRHI